MLKAIGDAAVWFAPHLGNRARGSMLALVQVELAVLADWIWLLPANEIDA